MTIIDPTHADEFQRLQFLENDAERRYQEAVEQSDHTAAANAARDWRTACEALDVLLEIRAEMPGSPTQPVEVPRPQDPIPNNPLPTPETTPPSQPDTASAIRP